MDLLSLEIKTLFLDTFDAHNVRHDGTKLAKALILFGRAYWILEQHEIPRAKALFRWIKGILEGAFEVELTLKDPSRAMATENNNETQHLEQPIIVEISNNPPMEQPEEQDILELDTEELPDEASGKREHEEEENSQDIDHEEVVQTTAAHKRWFKCMQIPQDGHTFRECKVSKRVYGQKRRGRRNY